MSRRVLLVDDDDELREVLQKVLQRKFEVGVARSGEEALALVAGNTWHAALVDKNLPGMDGLDVIRHLRRRQPGCVSVLMTAMPSVESAVAALRLSVADYLLKPSPELDRVGDRIAALIAEREAGSNEQVRALEQQLQRAQEQIARMKIEIALADEIGRGKPPR